MKTSNQVPVQVLKKISLVLVFLTFMQLHAFSQVKELSRHYENYSWSSLDAPESVNASHVIEINGATWLRLHFDEVKLKAGSYLKVKSLEDGAVQKLNARQLKLWYNSTAYFNGNKVEVTLHKSANDPDASIKIIQIEVGDPEPESICGKKDDRKATNDKAVGRLVPIGCTGWIIKNGKIVTAGHCARSSMQVIEFNVPKSASNGNIKHPAPEHQYTINQGSIVKGSATSHGTDWAVFTVYNNSKTGKSPIKAQGKSFNVVQVNKVKNVRITGYGADDGSANQTNQTHVGPYYTSTNNKLYYTTDTRGGNSGSPVIDEATGNAIGVHTHGGCNSQGGANSGTNAKRKEFWNAMGLGSTPPPPPPPSDIPIGKLIGLKGNNGKYVCSESGKKAMMCNRTAAAGWEKFTVVDAGGGKIALKGNNGKYVTSGSPMWCNSSSLGTSAKFSWIDAGGGKIALKGSHGKYVCSENGLKSMNCNRSKLGSWEKFTYQIFKSAQSISENVQSVALFPNPASGEFRVLTNGFNNATFTLLDMRGAVVLQKNNIANEMNIATTDIPAGVYIVKINDAQNTVIERLIIK